MLFEEVTLTLVGFQLINDADKSKHENDQIKRKFENTWQSLKSKLANNSLNVNQLDDIELHDTLIKDLLIFDSSQGNIKPEQFYKLTLNGLLSQPHCNIGQTLVLLAKPATECPDYHPLAQECLKGLKFPVDSETSSKEVYLTEGKLFGSPIFEYQGEESDRNFRHLWIWFDIHPMTKHSVQQRYREIKKLLCCRSKILFSFQQAKNATKEADHLYFEVKSNSEAVREQVEKGKAIVNLEEKYQELDNLKTCLQEVAKLSFDLFEEIRYLQYTPNTINSNSHNYLTELQLIELDKQPQDNLDFLHQFYQRSQNQFLKQINIDLNYITPCYDLANQTIAVIKGYIDIEQTKSDRALKESIDKKAEAEAKSDRHTQNLIQSVGAGIGAGISTAGIIATSYPLITAKPWAKPSLHKPLHPFIASVLVSFVAGAIVGLIVWWITKKILESNKN